MRRWSRNIVSFKDRAETDVRDLMILGGDVHGAEMAEIAERASGAGAPYRLRGFVVAESRAALVGKEINGHPVLGKDLTQTPAHDVMIVRNQNPGLRRHVEASFTVSRLNALRPSVHSTVYLFRGKFQGLTFSVEESPLRSQVSGVRFQGGASSSRCPQSLARFCSKLSARRSNRICRREPKCMRLFAAPLPNVLPIPC